jgi:rhodanese-related sulfurtransferase
MSWCLRTVRAGVLATLLFGGATAAFAASPDVRTVDPAQAQAMAQAGVTVIDVRRVDEWQSTGVIPGSLLITAFDASGRPVPDFVEMVRARVAPDAPVVIVCRSGNRSAVAARLLADQAGYTNLHNAAGGISEWARSGRPLAPCPSC